MSEVAAKCGIDRTFFWRLVKSKQALPEPTTRRGGRFFYTQGDLEAIQKMVVKLRSEGRIK